MSIILTNLSKRYGDNVIVNNVSLTIEDGELFVLLGSSGSGKSSILRLIAGLTQPDEGRIDLHGRDVTFLAPQKRNIGFVFQNYSIFSHMTVAENIAFGLRIRQVAAAEQKNRVEELMDIVGLAGLGGRYASQLSGGQQQRVALARALAYQPAVILLDEPFGALDVKIRTQLRASFKEIQRRLNITTILVTHDQEEAFELADRIGVVDHGSLIEVGTSEELYYRPRKEFTAAFIGGGNVMVGWAKGKHIRLGSVQLPFLPQSPPHDEYSSARIVFRPEAVVLSSKDMAQPEGLHPLGQGCIVERVFSGAFERLRVEVDDLRGARMVMPRLQFGQHAPQIQVQFTGAASGVPMTPGQQVSVWLRDYHILEPGGLRILIYGGLRTQEATAVEFGGYLAEAADVWGTLLTAALEYETPSDTQARLMILKHRYLASAPRIETVINKDSTVESVLRLFHENHYELIVIDRENGLRGSLAWQMLGQTQTPVLLTGNNQLPVERILICTAAGEPGKSDIRFGGRLGRLLGARATLFHVNLPATTIEELRRTENHLKQGQSLLEGLGLACEYKTAENEKPVEGILAEIAAGNYGLVVIGAPAPRLADRFLWSDLAIQIVSGTDRPILIVPMQE